MTAKPQAQILSGSRLHLNHGPIDLIVAAFGPDRQKAYEQARARFETLLEGLVAELPILRAQSGPWPKGVVAQRMAGVVQPFAPEFVTPMAAVAGAVADEICAAMTKGCELSKAYVNNGGDIAVYLGEGQSLVAAVHDGRDAGRVLLASDQPGRGLATSGWRGRSHSMGIADAVTVVARSAAEADVAATLIANAVDLPGHTAIRRVAANRLSPDSDLGHRLVTVDVGVLSDNAAKQALGTGKKYAQDCRKKGLILGAALFLGDHVEIVGVLSAPGLKASDGEMNARLQIA